MKVQASGILILIACILTGCGKSMKDVAGVYETAEIKEPQSSGSYYSTTWVLDLAESGTFTLKENRLRKSIVKTREPVPMNGSEESGTWQLLNGEVSLTFVLFRQSPVIDLSGFDEAVAEGNPFDQFDEPRTVAKPIREWEDVLLRVPLEVQSSGDLIAGGQFDGNFDEKTITFEDYDIKGLRFKRVE